MIKIGTIELSNRVVAAPLAGISDKAWRLVARSQGCSLVYSEMVSAAGLVYAASKTREIADNSGEDRPVAVQIFGFDPQIMGQAAAIVAEMGADIIDINMGCPTPKVIKSGAGAALMLDLFRSREIMREVVLGAGGIPVTIKMRKGWDDQEVTCLELAEVAEEEGIRAITLHPRTRMQFFSGQADWDLIRELKNRVKIPVIGNGDIVDAETAVKMLDYTGCDAVMIGRAALGNPFIYREAVALVEKGRRIPEPQLEERLNMAIRHLDLIISFKGEDRAVREMRKHFSWYVKGRPGVGKIRAQINQASTRKEILAALQSGFSL